MKAKLHALAPKLKLYACHAVGNYVFFCPLVLLLTPALWGFVAAAQYLQASVLIAALGGPLYSAFMAKFWLKLWGYK